MAFARVRKVGAERPGANSLWLLPSGPDQIGECTVRPTPTGAYGRVCSINQRGLRQIMVVKEKGGHTDRPFLSVAKQIRLQEPFDASAHIFSGFR